MHSNLPISPQHLSFGICVYRTLLARKCEIAKELLSEGVNPPKQFLYLLHHEINKSKFVRKKMAVIYQVKLKIYAID